MAWLGVAYEVIASDGFRVVIGNSAGARADSDWAGWLDPESNIQGLLDGATVRAIQTDLVEADGQSFGPSWLGGRSGTITGFLDPNRDIVTQAQDESRIKRASRSLHSDGILRWTPPNDSSPRQLRVRRGSQPSFTGRRPKAFQLTLASADPYALSSTEQKATITPGQAAGEIGIQDPLPDPMTSPLNVTAQQTVVTNGDAPTWPRFRIDGPITNPTILNNTTGQQVVLNYTLAAGEWLDVYPERGRVLAGGTADRYSAYDFTQSSWWQLGPSANDVRLLAVAYSAGALLTVYYRDAWE